MEDQCSPLNWAYYYQEEGGNGMMDELKHSLLYATLELETTIVSAREELARKDDELLHLKALLSRTTKERDEAIAKSQRLMLEKLLLIQQHHHHQKVQIEPPASGTTTTTSIEEEPRRGDSYNTGLSSSDCDENVIASPPPAPGKEYCVSVHPPLHPAELDLPEKFEMKMPLPENGKFLQAVTEAGPLLQTLLLAGPLPQWQHPPPRLSAIDIPPVTISSPRPRLLHQDSCLSVNTSSTKKRAAMADLHCDSSCSPPSSSKYQRVVHQSSLTNIF